VIGIVEMMNSERNWRYSLMTEEIGCKVLEVDLTNVGGWRHLSDQMGIVYDVQLTKFIARDAQRQRMRTTSIGESIEKDGEKLGCIGIALK
jgi:hypothetical protein